MAKGNMPHFDYAVWWSPEDDAYLAHAVAIPGTVTHGESPQEALAGAMSIAQEWIAFDEKSIAVNVLTMHDVERAPVPKWTPEAIKAIRRNFAVSQAVFADMMNVDLGTVRSWEQGVRNPSGPSARLLEVAAVAPGVFWRNILHRDGTSAVAS